MQTRDEVGILFLLDNRLKFERKPTNRTLDEEPALDFMEPYSQAISILSDSITSYRDVRWCLLIYGGRVDTLIMMTRVDWKRDGFAAGSSTDALDWKD